MEGREDLRSEQFLKLFRMLEGLLEKRYAGKRTSSGSVVMEYLRDADSAPVRTDLGLRIVFAFILSPGMGYRGIWSAWPVGWIVGAALSIVFFASAQRRLQEQQA